MVLTWNGAPIQVAGKGEKIITVPALGDFRLMDRVVVDALSQLHERQRFMKGLFAWVGFKTVVVDYTRQARAAGTTKFSGWRLWNLAIDQPVSLSCMAFLTRISKSQSTTQNAAESSAFFS